MQSPTQIIICGEKLTADPLGCLFWAREATLIVSDLHFEKGSSFAARGAFLPPYDTRTTLNRVGALIQRYQPKRVISLGDAFHDRDAEFRMDQCDAALLTGMLEQADWLWILGNHDPEPSARFAAASEVEAQIGSLIFRHEPLPGDQVGEIAGHLHPCARVVSEGRVLRRRCFAADGVRLIMPAFGAYTGGLNVLDDAFVRIFCNMTAWVLGAKGVYPIGVDRLTADVHAGQRRVSAR